MNDTAMGNKYTERKNPSPLIPFSSSTAHSNPKNMVPATKATVRTSRFHRACWYRSEASSST